MPNGVKFDTMAEKILAMSSPSTMIGEIEIVATSKMLKRKIEVVDDRGHHLVYGAAYTSQPPLYVRYIHNNDAGHYEAGLVIENPASIGLPPTMADISPISARAQSTVAKQKARSGKSQILTSSPYKKALEEDKRRLPTKKASKPRKKWKKAKQKETWFCFYCEQDVEDMICCQTCKEWAHSACAGTKGPKFICERCQSAK